MDTLAAVLDHPTPFPGGLFWLHRGEDPPLPRVSELLAEAAARGVDGGLVPIENFDEALRDVLRLVKGLDTGILDDFASDRRIWTAPTRPSGSRSFPVVRLNGLPVKVSPTVCRRLECAIGGHAEAAEAAVSAGVDVILARTRSGVLAFGTDADLRKAFSPFGIKTFDLHAIETKRLRYDSGERGLLREALSRALAREHRLTVIRRRSTDLLAPSNPEDGIWAPLRQLVGRLAGVVPKHAELRWREGIGVRLDWADDRLWLLVEPRTIFDGIKEQNRSAATDFAWERTVRRYNRQLNDLIAFWAELLAKDGAEIKALDITSGVDAAFQMGVNTAYSMRVRP